MTPVVVIPLPHLAAPHALAVDGLDNVYLPISERSTDDHAIRVGSAFHLGFNPVVQAGVTLVAPQVANAPAAPPPQLGQPGRVTVGTEPSSWWKRQVGFDG